MSALFNKHNDDDDDDDDAAPAWRKETNFSDLILSVGRYKHGGGIQSSSSGVSSGRNGGDAVRRPAPSVSGPRCGGVRHRHRPRWSHRPAELGACTAASHQSS